MSLYLYIFNDILVFSKNVDTHRGHFQITIDILRRNKLFAKRSKCQFGCKEGEYLGHIISE
jgi:hypothetical protein